MLIMNTITIPKKEYQALVDKALCYDYLKTAIKKNDLFCPPPTKDSKEIIKAFKATKLYNSAFLKSLAKGLKRSACFNQDENIDSAS